MLCQSLLEEQTFFYYLFIFIIIIIYNITVDLKSFSDNCES